MEKNFKPKDFSKLLGVSVKTLQRWDVDGKLIAYRNPKGRRFYTYSQYEEYMGNSKVGKFVTCPCCNHKFVTEREDDSL